MGIDPLGMALFQACCEAGSSALAMALIERGAHLEFRSPRENWTPLMGAAHHGCSDSVSALIASGAMIAARDSNGNAPLHLAVSSGNLDSAALLIEAGANAAEDLGRGTLTRLAVRFGRVETLLLLLRSGAPLDAKFRVDGDQSTLAFACARGGVGCVQALLDAGAKPGAAELIACAKAGELGCAQALLGAGLDPAAADRERQSAAAWAAKEGRWDFLLLLESHGLDLASPLPCGRRASAIAAKAGKQWIVRHLAPRELVAAERLALDQGADEASRSAPRVRI